MSRLSGVLIWLVLFWYLAVGLGPSMAMAEKKPEPEPKPPAKFSVPEELGEAIQKKATEVQAQLSAETRNIFRRAPLGFDAQTLDRASQWLVELPTELPALGRQLSQQVRLLGVVGSLLLFAFLSVLFYSIFGWKKVFEYLKNAAEPLEPIITETYAPFLRAGLRVVAATLVPLFLYGLFLLVEEFTDFTAPWFLLIGSFLKLWALGALIIGLLREILISGIFPLPSRNATVVYRFSRFLTFYVLLSIAIFLSAKAFQVPQDILALLHFVISISIVLVSLLFLLRKQTIVGLLPELPYKSYQVFVNVFRRLYYPALFFTFLTAVAWCFGYKDLAIFLCVKTWAVVGAFLGLIFLFHFVKGILRKWLEKKDPENYKAILVYKSLQDLLIFLTGTSIVLAILYLLGILGPIQILISFPLIIIGDKPISLWTVFEIIIIFIAIVYFSSLIRSYLDYKIYPLFGIDEGLAYSINTLVSYLLVTVGIFVTLSIVGIDIRTVMVFAGAIGIGIGLGLQKIASNLISGIIIIFGRKVRKGDWVKVGDTVGLVQRVSLASTFIWTRDNIEHIIPNSDLIANIITNYSLTDPEIRVHVPVGVTYNADPQEVRRILLEVSEKNEDIKKTRKPMVWFTEFGDSSINFELLVWMDIRRFSEQLIKSKLYFEIFEALRQAGVEIPFPQRDLHFKSGLSVPEK